VKDEPIKVPETPLINNPPERKERIKVFKSDKIRDESGKNLENPPVDSSNNNVEAVRSLDPIVEPEPVVSVGNGPSIPKPENIPVNNDPAVKPNQPFVEIPVSPVAQPIVPRNPQILPHETPNNPFQVAPVAPAQQQPFYMYPYIWITAILSYLLRFLFR